MTVVDFCEAAALREHLEKRSLYPEAADDLRNAQRAIALCAQGRGETKVTIIGRESQAAVACVALGLESFVNRAVTRALAGSAS